MHIVIGIISAVVMLMLLVVVHEIGHFSAAKATGIKVNEFSVGMGPLIAKKRKKDTDYSLRLIPIGGYVAMEGENEESDDEGAFNNKPWYVRAFVLVAGPFMNFLLAVVIFAGLITYMGTSVSDQINSVKDGSPAHIVGLMEGDRIVGVDGSEIDDDRSAADHIHEASEKKDSIELIVLRNGEMRKFDLKFDKKEDGSKFLGISFDVNHNIIIGFKQAIKQSVEIEKMILNVIGDLITGRGSMNDISGPVGLVTVVDQVSRTGIFNMLYLTAMLSLNLGLVNILPFPALDGGRLLFVFIRLFTGKTITDEIESRIHFLGIVALFIFMILITFKDINTLITN